MAHHEDTESTEKKRCKFLTTDYTDYTDWLLFFVLICGESLSLSGSFRG